MLRIYELSVSNGGFTYQNLPVKLGFDIQEEVIFLSLFYMSP